MKKIEEFILESNKVYPILIAGMMICVLQITSNVAYEMGQDKADLYNYRYARTYTTLAENYQRSFPNEPIENSLQAAEFNCNFFDEEVKSGQYMEWLDIK